MRLIYATILPLLSLVSLTTAAGTCASSGSLSWPPVGDCSGVKYPTAVQNCRACAMNNADAFTACLKAAGIGKRDTIGEQFYSTIETKRGLGSRAIALTCGTNEGCYKFTDGSLLCLNLGTGMFKTFTSSRVRRGNGKLTTFVARFISRRCRRKWRLLQWQIHRS
jgi:hypothetical protein